MLIKNNIPKRKYLNELELTSEQFDTLKSIILKLKDKYDIEKIIGHYQVEASKECPSFDVPGWLIENGVV